MIYLIFY